MKELANQLKFTLKGNLDEVDDDMTIRVVTGGKNPTIDEENLESIKADLFDFFSSLSATDKIELSIVAKVIND